MTDNEINEPLSEYFNSEKFLKEYKKLTISGFGEEDNSGLEFNLRLKPVQRLELLRYLNDLFFSGTFEDKIETTQKEIKFDKINENIV